MESAVREMPSKSAGERLPGSLVLIVSNDRKFLDYYREEVVNRGLVPVTVSTVEGTVAGIILDQVGASLDGLPLPEHAKQGQGHIPILIVTLEPNSCGRQVLGLGAVCYIEQPVDSKQLLSALANPMAAELGEALAGHDGRAPSNGEIPS